MFWGLIMEPQKRYSQTIKKAFHISMASLDVSNSDGQPSQVMCGYEGRNYLLCTLQNPELLQSPLDLYFEEGTTVSFATNGKSHVHLTGYLTKEFDEEDSEGESDEELQQFEVTGQKKGRSVENADNEPSKKKLKQLEEVEDEDDSDDSDVDIEKLMGMEEGLSEEESEEEDGLEEEGADEEEESGEDEDEDDDEDIDEEEEDEDEEEEEVKPKATMNGLGKKSKKAKKEEQETPKKEKPGKDKSPLKQTPGPKAKKQENGNVDTKKKTETKKKENQQQSPQPSKKRTLPGGVVVEDLKEGQGDVAASNGKFVHVYYEGRLKSNNKVFDKTQNGPGFGFRLGKGEVIKGWDLGLNGMKVGGKRRITCPPNLAYGQKGSPPVIPPNSTLIFEVELKKIK